MLVYTIIYCAVVLILIGGLILPHLNSDTPGLQIFKIIYWLGAGVFVVAAVATSIAVRCHKQSTKRGR